MKLKQMDQPLTQSIKKMINKFDPIQKTKFILWYLSKKYPSLGYPIKIFGKISTLNQMKKYNSNLKKEGLKIFPSDRYIRDNNTPKQIYLVKSNSSSDFELKILGLFLNHLRMPYSIINLKDIDKHYLKNLISHLL